MELITREKTVKYIRAFLIISMLLSLALAALLSIIILAAKIAGPPPISVPQTSLFYANDDSIIGQSHTGQNRYWVGIDDVSPSIIDATITIEDQRFYNHHGFDFKRIAGAIIADVKAMAKVQGASTITQQYARNLYLDHDKTWKRKAMEALYTIRLEVNYSKKQILEGYLNTIYYGHGAYGIEAASRLYFNKHAKELSLAEASMLAGIPKGPSYYSPYAHENRAKQRQALILQEMQERGLITKQQAEDAKREKIALAPLNPHEMVEVAPYFQDAVQASLVNDLGIDEQMIQQGGLRVYTTLDTKLQALVEETVQHTIPTTTGIETAVVMTEPTTGEVKALVGGRNYEKSQFNRATQAYRQPGSTFKPFLYYAALEHGFTPATRLKSEYTTFKLSDGVSTYAPTNYNNYYANDFITMAQALAVSDNVYAVKTHLFLGEDMLVKTAKQFGIKSKLYAVPSLALGSSPVKPIEMVNAYGMFANGGKQISPIFIRRVVDREGTVLYDARIEGKQVLHEHNVFVMDEMMKGMFNSKFNGYATVTGQTIANKLTRPYAGKSGSTKTDSWMIGFTPQLVTGVWVGYDKEKDITQADEQRYAKDIWFHVMEEGLKDTEQQDFQKPSDVTAVDINPQNGKIATKGCPVSIKMYFAKGTEPTEYCMEHVDSKEDFQSTIKKEKEKQSWFKRYLPW
ncbi:transglycosylase domain-containing protein [Microbacteriaceae bacterium 4G12]